MQNITKRWLFAAMLIVCGVCLTGCHNQSADVPEQDNVEEDQLSYLTVVEDYLINEIGSKYSQGDVCIPSVFVVDVDFDNADEILVWGDFWVFNYVLAGDTLKTVSGGDHPGLMHVGKTDKGYVVTAFEEVASGAGNLESAKSIFGDRYDAFNDFNSNEEIRERYRTALVREAVERYGIPATMYQDYGWPVVVLN